MKKIVIVRGNEFKVYEDQIAQNEDVFEEIYDKARVQKHQLECYADRLSSGQDKKTDGQREAGEWDGPAEYLNNIIAFCGERGQGKSTAMQHFVKELGKEDDKEVLPVIDPTAMEMAHDIVDIIISRLFRRFQDRTEKDEEKDMGLSLKFQKVHRNMSILKNARTFIEQEYAYSGSLQNLTDIMESMELRTDIISLIDEYLKYRHKKMLVIPIDDLDLNLTHVYQVAEQLRKYLMIPRVIIVMAVNIDQLTLCVERELLENLRMLKDSGRWNIQREARNMSSRYMEKLIPFPRRMQLPDIRTIAEDGENAVEMIYRDQEGNKLFDSETQGIEKGILNLIFQKTGLVYVAKPDEVHPIIPRTLRELVNLAALLGDMGEKQAENLETFERYFCHVWLENNLADEKAELVREIAAAQLKDLHNDAFLLLYQMLGKRMEETEKNLSGNFVKKLPRAVQFTYEAMLDGKEKPNNGELMNCLRLLRQGSRSDISRLTMAVMTMFSIRMLKLKAAGKWETLYDFIGGNIFGDFRLIRGEAVKDRGGKDREITTRMQFEYPVTVFLQAICKTFIENFSVSGLKQAFSEKHLAALLLFMGTYSEFKGKDGLSRELVSNNNQVATKAVFDINQLFVSAVSEEKVMKKISFEKWGIDEVIFKEIYMDAYRSDAWKSLVCNMEELMCLAQYLQENREINDAAAEADYYVHFTGSIKRFLERLRTYLYSVDLLEGVDDIKDKKSKLDGKRDVDLIVIMKQSTFTADSLPVCRANTRFSKLISNLELMKNYVETLKKVNSEYDYSAVFEEIDFLNQAAQSHKVDGTIGRELSDRYNELQKEIMGIEVV